ncbi:MULTISPECIES: glycosyltransferase [Streptococcaceae]|uniref:glycosyltransferase n=1 Tax=Streptococcaceae TaxID=1300 RepID=UPI002FCA64E8
MKKKLSVFTLYSKEGASSNYRAYIFKNKLENEFDIKWYNFWGKRYSEKYIHNKKKYFLQIIFSYIIAILKRLWQLYFVLPKSDVIFLQKGVIPKIRPTFLNHLKKKNIRIVFDVDDAIYLFGKDNSDVIAKISDLVISGNTNLMNHYKSYNDNCVILPTTDVTPQYYSLWSDTFENKIIGWIGSKTTVNNLESVVEPINKLVEKYPSVKFHIISNDAFDFPERIKNTKLIKWSSDTYLEELSKLSIGIMPLEDNPINRGKCGFKLIQYLNMKKPVIGSNVGVNGEIINKNGAVINSSEEWYDQFEKLLFDKASYNQSLENIENNFFKEYHFDIISNKLISYLKGN